MLATRIATALVLIPIVLLGVVYLPTLLVGLVIGVFMLLGAWEWGGLAGLDESARAGFVALVALIVVLVALFRGADIAIGVDNLTIGVACLWWLAAIGWITRFPNGWPATLGRPAAALGVGAIALSAPVAAITYLHQSDDGPLLLLIMLFLIWGADTGAYCAGRLWGRHKLAPRVSPGKTREGALGGIVSALLLAALGAALLQYHGWRAAAFVLLGGWVAIVSVVGDLTLSMFKRHAGIKDSGTLFPGHGGVLDRLDSLLAAAPWFVAALHWLPVQR